MCQTLKVLINFFPNQLCEFCILPILVIVNSLEECISKSHVEGFLTRAKRQRKRKCSNFPGRKELKRNTERNKRQEKKERKEKEEKRKGARKIGGKGCGTELSSI